MPIHLYDIIFKNRDKCTSVTIEQCLNKGSCENIAKDFLPCQLVTASRARLFLHKTNFSKENN
jgi:hypothetical protein